MVDGRPARPAAERAVQTDNDRVRVSHWRFAPNVATGCHGHELAFFEIEVKDGGSG